MLIRFMRFAAGSFLGIALAKGAWAANVETLANSANFGGEFRAEWSHTDNGLMKAEGYTPPSENAFDTQEANLKVWGKINPNTEYKVRFSLLGHGLLEGYGKHNMGAFSWAIGRQLVHQGGWDNWADTHRKHAQGFYQNAWAFSKYADALTLSFNVAGEVSLQLVNDVTQDDMGFGADIKSRIGQWNRDAHPTFIVAWHGEFGPIMPLIHYGTFDNQKSSWFDIGIKTTMSGLTAYLDFSQTTQADKVPDGDKSKAENNVATAYTLYAGYEIKKTAMPWVYFSAFDVKQHTEDAKHNPDIASQQAAFEQAGHTPTAADYFGDNGTVWGFGADLLMMGDNWAPYIAIVGRSGKFQDPADAEKSETKSDMTIKLGAYGDI